MMTADDEMKAAPTSAGTTGPTPQAGPSPPGPDRRWLHDCHANGEASSPWQPLSPVVAGIPGARRARGFTSGGGCGTLGVTKPPQ